MHRRHLLLACGAGALALTGCGSIPTLTADVRSFGGWPDGRAPGTYVIERLPSQAARGQEHVAFEVAAGRAMERAGFKPAASAASADVIVQIGARVTRVDVPIWDDPLWWRWGPNYWRGSPAWRSSRSYWGGTVFVNPPPPEREVGILLRDRTTNTPVYEARALSTGYRSDAPAFEALFAAAMADFPKSRPDVHRVTVPFSQP